MASLFFELLQLTGRSRNALSHIPSDEEWREAYAVACSHAVAGVMFPVLEGLPPEQRPKWELLLEWYALVERIKRKNRQLDHDTVAVAKLFADDGRRSLILKGQGVALYYPHPELRTPGDVDIWVDGDREKLIADLRRRAGDPQRRVGDRVRISYHHAAFDLPTGTEVEVHFTPSLMRFPLASRRLQRFFHAQKEEQFAHIASLPQASGHVAVPTRAFNLVFLLVHIYRHLVGEGIGFRQLMDYHYCLHAGVTEDERTAAIRMFRRLKMERFVAAAMYVEQTVFGTDAALLLLPPDERAGRVLLAEVMRGGNFCRYDTAPATRQDENHVQRGWRLIRSNWKLFRYFPLEVACNPLYSLFHLAWRWRNGFLPRQEKRQ